jgi:hypothetical protein
MISNILLFFIADAETQQCPPLYITFPCTTPSLKKCIFHMDDTTKQQQKETTTQPVASTSSNVQSPPTPQRNSSSNVVPVKPIIGLEKVSSQVLRDAVVRAATGILGTEPKNMDITAKVVAKKCTALLHVKGIARLGPKALDPTFWCMDEDEIACIIDTRYDVASKTITVMMREPVQKSEQTDRCPIQSEPLEVSAGNVDDNDFVGVAVTGDVNPSIQCVASLIAANILAVARRRDGSPSATVEMKTVDETSYYIIETKGLIHFDARVLVSTSWAGNGWPKLAGRGGILSSLPMYFDPIMGIHHTLLAAGEIAGAFTTTAQDRAKECTTASFPTGVRFGFKRTYTIPEQQHRTKRVCFADDTDPRKKQHVPQ